MPRYLIVDDEPLNRALLVHVLSSTGHCEEAENGRQALEMVQAGLDRGERYDLICCDLLMQQGNGYQLVREVRQLERGENPCKIFVITTSNTTWDRTDLLLDGRADAFIAKPFRTQHLRALIDEHGLGPA